MNDMLKTGDVINVQGKIVRVIEREEGTSYMVRFGSRQPLMEMPAYRCQYVRPDSDFAWDAGDGYRGIVA